MRQRGIVTRQKIFVGIILSFVVAGMTSCVGPPVATNMIPTLDPTAFRSTGKTVKVEVSEAETTIRGPASDRLRVTKAGFQEALFKTLDKSGMFGAIFTDGHGDYALRATLIAQQYLLRPVTALLFVHYELSEVHTPQVLWRENILSHYQTREPIDNAEGAARENLAQLLRKLAGVLAQ